MRIAGLVRLLPLVALLAGLAAALALLRAWQDRGRDREERPPERVEGPARVVDGDTLRIGRIPIRLAGLDAPELAQSCARPGGAAYPCGEEARAALARLIGGRPVACRIRGRDRYRRALARCEAGGVDLGASLVRAGLAVAYRGYAEEEREARAARRGLWAGTFQPPEAWRREHRGERARERAPRVLPPHPALP